MEKKLMITFRSKLKIRTSAFLTVIFLIFEFEQLLKSYDDSSHMVADKTPISAIHDSASQLSPIVHYPFHWVKKKTELGGYQENF